MTKTTRALGAVVLLWAWQPRPSRAQEPARTISVEEAVALFSTHSPEMRIARSRLRAAQGQSRQDRAISNPTLSVTNEDLGAYSERYFNVNQAIDFLWERGARGSRAEARATVGRAAFLADSADAVLDLRRVYADAWHAAETTAALEAAAAVVAEVVEDAAIRVADGDLARYDLRRLTVARGTLDRRLGQARLAVADAERRLGALTSPDTAVERARPAGLEAVPALPSGFDPVRFARAARPELTAARSEREAREATATLTRRGWLSGTSLTGGYKTQSDDRDGLFLGVQLPVPLWDRRGGAVEAAVSGVEEAEAEVALVERLVAREARLAADRLSSARAQRVAIGDDGSAEASALIESARVAYDEGEVGVVELVDAAEAFVEARLLEADARRNEWIAWYELEHSVGGMPAGPEPGASR